MLRINFIFNADADPDSDPGPGSRTWIRTGKNWSRSRSYTLLRDLLIFNSRKIFKFVFFRFFVILMLNLDEPLKDKDIFLNFFSTVHIRVLLEQKILVCNFWCIFSPRCGSAFFCGSIRIRKPKCCGSNGSGFRILRTNEKKRCNIIFVGWFACYFVHSLHNIRETQKWISKIFKVDLI